VPGASRSDDAAGVAREGDLAGFMLVRREYGTLLVGARSAGVCGSQPVTDSVRGYARSAARPCAEGAKAEAASRKCGEGPAGASHPSADWPPVTAPGAGALPRPGRRASWRAVPSNRKGSTHR